MHLGLIEGRGTLILVEGEVRMLLQKISTKKNEEKENQIHNSDLVNPTSTLDMNHQIAG